MASLDGFLNDIDELAEGGEMYGDDQGGGYEEQKTQEMTPQMQLEQELKLLHWHKLANEASLKAAIIRSKRVRGKDRDRGELMTQRQREKAVWLRQIIQDEYSKPLEVDEAFMKEYKENEEREEQKLEEEVARHISTLRGLKKKLLDQDERVQRGKEFQMRKMALGDEPQSLQDFERRGTAATLGTPPSTAGPGGALGMSGMASFGASGSAGGSGVFLTSLGPSGTGGPGALGLPTPGTPGSVASSMQGYTAGASTTPAGAPGTAGTQGSTGSMLQSLSQLVDLEQRIAALESGGGGGGEGASDTGATPRSAGGRSRGRPGGARRTAMQFERKTTAPRAGKPARKVFNVKVVDRSSSRSRSKGPGGRGGPSKTEARQQAAAARRKEKLENLRKKHAALQSQQDRTRRQDAVIGGWLADRRQKQTKRRDRTRGRAARATGAVQRAAGASARRPVQQSRGRSGSRASRTSRSSAASLRRRRTEAARLGSSRGSNASAGRAGASLPRAGQRGSRLSGNRGASNRRSTRSLPRRQAPSGVGARKAAAAQHGAAFHQLRKQFEASKGGARGRRSAGAASGRTSGSLRRPQQRAGAAGRATGRRSVGGRSGVSPSPGRSVRSGVSMGRSAGRSTVRRTSTGRESVGSYRSAASGRSGRAAGGGARGAQAVRAGRASQRSLGARKGVRGARGARGARGGAGNGTRRAPDGTWRRTRPGGRYDQADLGLGVQGTGARGGYR